MSLEIRPWEKQIQFMAGGFTLAENQINRRDFVKVNGCGLAAAVLTGVLPGQGNAGKEALGVVRIGVVGTGGRGKSLMSSLLSLPQVEIPAICDINPEALAAAGKIPEDKGHPAPEVYSGETDYEKLMARDDLDAVIIATPWDLHTPMAVCSMKAGKITGCEVPIAYTLEECWELIDTWESTGTDCMMLENWSFRPDNLAVLNMIRVGLLGRITHVHCAHSHDCIDHWFFDRETGEDRWGARYLLEHNRDQYPTHQQGPVLSWMDINCGDYYDTLTSASTDSLSINAYFKRMFPGHPNGNRTYMQGDIVTTVVKTKKGKSLVINYDMQSPRPYDNRWMVQGTIGIYNEQRDSVYLTGKSPEYHEWEPFPPYQEEYQHPFAKAASGGHGGADGIMLNRFVDAVRFRKPLPLNLYDGVLMAAIGPLSEQSISQGSRVVQVPDFTRGKWETRNPYFGKET
ncbi:MAG: Gfo/Idh/MocA family oxidoreductase [Acidobacteriota bacterium]